MKNEPKEDTNKSLDQDFLYNSFNKPTFFCLKQFSKYPASSRNREKTVVRHRKAKNPWTKNHPFESNNFSPGIYNGNTRKMYETCSNQTITTHNNVIDVVLTSSLLTSNRFQTQFSYFHWWLWTSKWRLGFRICEFIPSKPHYQSKFLSKSSLVNQHEYMENNKSKLFP